MWKADHKPHCTDQSRFSIVRERASVEDKDGNVLEADPSDGLVVHGDCSDCYAEAEWVE